MARKTTKAAKSQKPEDAMTGFYQDGVNTMADVNTKLMDSFTDMSAQMASFLTQRFEEDVKVQHDLLQCKTLQEVQHVQMQFFENAFKQYQDNSAKMLDIGTSAFQGKASK